MQQLDERIVELSVEVDGQVNTYDTLYIKANGMKFGNSTQNVCTVTILNLNKETRNKILTETSPFNDNNTPKKLSLFAGRKSTGKFLVFSGDISPNTSVGQPADIPVVLKALTKNFQKGKIVSRNAASSAQLSQISQNVADDLGVSLNFQAIDKQIANYQFNGGALKQINKLADMGDYDVYIDDTDMVVKNKNVALSNEITILNKNTGMVGIPETTDQGVRVKFLINTQVVVGGLIRVESEIYPQTSGDYVIYKLGFEIANREEPFYWIASAKRK